MIDMVEKRTADNHELHLNFAFNYGGRDDVVRAVQRIAAKVADGDLAPGDISERTICENLDTADIPDPDLIIRTSGELRLSNFLLWQSAYSELEFMPVFWPDFGRDELSQAIASFAGRVRRYGGVEARSEA